MLVITPSFGYSSFIKSKTGRIARAREQKEKRLEWRGPQKSASGRLEDADVTLLATTCIVLALQLEKLRPISPRFRYRLSRPRMKMWARWGPVEDGSDDGSGNNTRYYSYFRYSYTWIAKGYLSVVGTLGKPCLDHGQHFIIYLTQWKLYPSPRHAGYTMSGYSSIRSQGWDLPSSSLPYQLPPILVT